MLDFPNSPTLNQIFTSSSGMTWLWDGAKWVNAASTAAAFLPLAGGVLSGPLTGTTATFAGETLTGPLTGTSATFTGLSAPQAIGDNRIINGDMRIDQRNNGASGTAAGYTIDRWSFQASQASKFTWQRLTSNAPGFPYCLGFTSSSAFTCASGDYFQLRHALEGDAISDFQWGTATAQPVTLSFYVYSSLTGTFSGSIRDYGFTRTYPFTFSLPSPAWTKIVVTIPGDTAGSWVLSGNSGALFLTFDLGSGSGGRGTAGAWAAGASAGATGSVNVVGTNAANFYITGVKLEVGSIATPFNRQSLAKCMADCQRHFQLSQVGVTGTGNASFGVYATAYFNTRMRATPSIVTTANNSSNCTLSSYAPSDTNVTVIVTITATGQYSNNFNFSASAEL